MTKQVQSGGQQSVRSSWERPALVRLDAADAEMMAGPGSDGMSTRSMNS
jgi:hypothetical protein